MAQKALKRDKLGRLLPGSAPLPGAGRKPGARAEFTENFIADFNEVWLEHGPRALLKLAKTKPTEFVKAAVALQPRNVDLNIEQLKCVTIDFTGFDLDDDEPLDIEGEHTIVPDNAPTDDRGLLHDAHQDAKRAAGNVAELTPDVQWDFSPVTTQAEPGPFHEPEQAASQEETHPLADSPGDAAPLQPEPTPEGITPVTPEASAEASIVEEFSDDDDEWSIEAEVALAKEPVKQVNSYRRNHRLTFDTLPPAMAARQPKPE
jgi:hypothetical protein